MYTRRNTVLIAALVVFYSCHWANADYNWTRWRGNQADGHTAEQGLPQRWSNETITWKTPLVGRGQSSPTIWGERIFLTSAIDQGRQRVVLCVDRISGAVVWQQVAWKGTPEPSHVLNGWASSTCCTDGKHVYAFFGRGGGLHCYTLAGKHVWSHGLGRFEGPWGTAASPLLVGNLVIQNCDADKDACIVALDKESGSEVWKTRRADHRGWSSPILVRTSARDEVVVNGHLGVSAYAPESGQLLWSCAGNAGRGSPTVTPAGDFLYVVNGLSGGEAICLRPGGTGDVTDSRRLWFRTRRTRDLSSPIIVGDVMLVIELRSALLTAYNKRNGEEVWKIRIGGHASASPISYDGLAIFITEAGDTFVIDPRADGKVIAKNSLRGESDEIFRASITPSNGQLFIRSDQNLYCVGTRRERKE